YLRDCLCTALNPVCAPCDDPAVLLACLEVKYCEVVRICNLERTFVLSPVTVRYWAPLNLFGKVIEQVCCQVAECPDAGQASFTSESTPGPFAESIRGFGHFGSLPRSVRVLISILSALLSKICGKDQTQLGTVIVPIVNLFQER